MARSFLACDGLHRLGHAYVGSLILKIEVTGAQTYLFVKFNVYFSYLSKELVIILLYNQNSILKQYKYILY